jgi:hypothetical protein
MMTSLDQEMTHHDSWSDYVYTEACLMEIMDDVMYLLNTPASMDSAKHNRTRESSVLVLRGLAQQGWQWPGRWQVMNGPAVD